MSNAKFIVLEDKKTLKVERTFNASKNKIWEAYSNPAILAKWWRPKGFETTIKHLEFVDGGYWHYGMKCIDPEIKDFYGQISWGKGTYHDIKPQDSFGYVDIFCDENAEPTPGMPESDTIVELSEVNGETTITSTTKYDTPEALAQVLEMGMESGFDETWDNLARVIESNN
jgi:uncharacterized protein YndB with AHSA1/START domain